jgi:hypothetical protein
MNRNRENPVVAFACEACRSKPFTDVIEDDDPSEPYKVCKECGERLRQLALRPAEWFNLAASHGWHKHLLHDDFYDQDGTACQPKIDCYSAEGNFAPTLNEAARSLSDLLSYGITRWHLGESEFNAFRTFAPEAVLDELAKRTATGNWQIQAVALTLCANVLKGTAASRVRAQYGRSCETNLLFSWAEAAACCLPCSEGLHKTVDALRSYEGVELRVRMSALMWFRSPAVLDWIECHAPATNVTNDWGRLAALSDPTWQRLDVWLVRGRPFNLIALDALAEFIPREGQAPIVKKLLPSLKGCPDKPTMMRALRDCMSADQVPRVTDRCTFLIKHLDEMRVE